MKAAKGILSTYSWRLYTIKYFILSIEEKSERKWGRPHSAWSWPWSPVMPPLNMSLLPWKTAFPSIQFSLSVVSDSLWPHGLQHARPPCPSPTPGVHSNSCPSSQWCIQPSHTLSCTSPPAFNLSQHQGLFQGVSPLHQVAEFQLQHQSFQWTPRTDLL